MNELQSRNPSDALSGSTMDRKERKTDEQQQQFQLCEVCKLNHNQGRRHIYFPNHKTSLRLLLARFQSKLSGVRLFLRTPTPLRPEGAHTSRFWCVFCDCDVVELGNPFARFVIWELCVPSGFYVIDWLRITCPSIFSFSLFTWTRGEVFQWECDRAFGQRGALQESEEIHGEIWRWNGPCGLISYFWGGFW